MKYWSPIICEKQVYVLTSNPLQIDDYVEFRNTLGFIERTETGWLCFVNYNGIKCFGEELNKDYAKIRV